MSAAELSSLSSAELEELASVDSLIFGDPDIWKNGKKELIEKGVFYYTKLIEETEENNCLSPQYFCKLGHYHLLLEDYHKALSAYNKYYIFDSEHWKHSAFLYGVGLVYYHFGAFSWATKFLQQLLYNDPHFAKAGEAHYKLGLIFKIGGSYEAAEKHFNCALGDKQCGHARACEVKFNMGHLCEIKGEFNEAKSVYEEVLRLPRKELTAVVHANALRQLGWLFHTAEEFDPENSHKALELLKKSSEIDPNNDQTWYLLGRCNSKLEKISDAFSSYSRAIEISNTNADAWCSLGVLYQEHNHLVDALQSYMCAVRLDRGHEAAWRNLAILYEACQQPKDAVVCYVNAQSKQGEANDKELIERVKTLKLIIKEKDESNYQSSRRALPSIEEAWTLRLPADLMHKLRASKCSLSATHKLRSSIAHGTMLPTSHSYFAYQSERLSEMTESTHENSEWQQTNQQLHVMHSLSQSRDSLSPNQKIELERTQHVFTLPERWENEGCSSQSQEDNNRTINSLSTSMNENQPSVLPSFDCFLKNVSVPSKTPHLSLSELERLALEESEIPNRPFPPLLSPCGISETMPSREVIETFRKSLENPAVSAHMYLDKCPPPKRPPAPIPRVPKDKLCPSTPTVYLENKRDAVSKALVNFCTHPSNPVTVIRGLASALKLDLGLFSTKTLVECNGDCRVEVRTQYRQPSDENWDAEGEKSVWKCESSRSFTTIAKYGEYQAATFQESLKEDVEKQKATVEGREETDLSFEKASGGSKKNFKVMKFGTNIDLSDEKKWRGQLEELQKLPWLFRLVSAGNMLSHVGQDILGMNTIQLYMKVPGSRTPGHQENNNFCALNINIGPGDCEWFATPEEYWGVIAELCEEHGLDYLSGSWWPILQDLFDRRVPVYRFRQKPGDLVWLNAGTVHWVQAIGWCNNVAWNVGLISAYQYQMAIERYEYNKLTKYKSIVPLIHLTWYLAQHICINDYKLFKMLKTCMMRTLWRCQKTLDDLETAGIRVVWHGKDENEPAHYCETCEVEVFNLLFVRRLQGGNNHLVFCEDCARKESPNLAGFVVLSQYEMEELMKIYDDFTVSTSRALLTRS